MIADLEANDVEVRMDLNGQPEDVQKQWLAEADGFPSANHFIMTHYVDGEHNIGMHYDKPISIQKESLITIVKTGEHGRPFRLEMLDGALIMIIITIHSSF